MSKTIITVWNFRWTGGWLNIGVCFRTIEGKETMLAPTKEEVELLWRALTQRFGKEETVEGGFNNLGDYWIDETRGFKYAAAEEQA